MGNLLSVFKNQNFALCEIMSNNNIKALKLQLPSVLKVREVTTSFDNDIVIIIYILPVFFRWSIWANTTKVTMPLHHPLWPKYYQNVNASLIKCNTYRRLVTWKVSFRDELRMTRRPILTLRDERRIYATHRKLIIFLTSNFVQNFYN